jgi:anaerobic selenocysteine-containing dehydrogenase
MYGRMPGVSYVDYRHARLIVVWGANPSTSGIHLVPHIRAATDAGAALVVIDPRRTSLTNKAAIHLQIRPGTDVAVTMSIHRFLFENGFKDENSRADYTRGADQLRAHVAD